MRGRDGGGSERLQLRAAHDVPVMVVCARYSGHRSRVLLWNAETDEFTPGQWLKGGVELCDVSPDGRYLAYVAETFHRSPPSYFAISRPPYLKALLFQPVVPYLRCDALFLDDRSYERVGYPLAADDWGGDSSYGRDREVEGNPLQRTAWRGETYPDRRLLRREEKRSGVREAIARFGLPAAQLLLRPDLGQNLYPAADELLRQAFTATWDHRGRLIVGYDWRLVAFSDERPDGTELIDLSDQTFRNVVAPDWAGRW